MTKCFDDKNVKKTGLIKTKLKLSQRSKAKVGSLIDLINVEIHLCKNSAVRRRWMNLDSI